MRRVANPAPSENNWRLLAELKVMCSTGRDKRQRKAKEQRKQRKSKKSAPPKKARSGRKRERQQSSSESDSEEPPPPRRRAAAAAPVPAPAPPPAPAAADDEDEEEDLPAEYNPFDIRRDHLRKQRKHAQADALVDPLPPVPPLSGGFAGSGYAGWRRGKPHMPWLVERLKAQGVDVSLPENIAVLDEVVAICEPVDLRPPCPFRLLCTNRYLEYVKGLARKVKRKGKFDRARALMDAHQQLVNLQARSQRHCRPSESEEAEVNCCECCSYIVHYLVRVVGNDVATFKYARAERVGGRIRVEYSAPARWRLIHDHVHWSEMHRMWARLSVSLNSLFVLR